MARQPAGERADILAYGLPGAARVNGSVGVEQGNEPLAEPVAQVRALPGDEPTAFGDQCGLLYSHLFGIEPGWALLLPEQCAEQCCLFGGESSAVCGHRYTTCRMAASSAASSVSLGNWSSRSSSTPAGRVREHSSASRSSTSGSTGWACVSW